MPTTTATLLRQHGFRATALRQRLLDLLRRSDRALTHAELEQRLDLTVDRVTVFRALNAFEEAGLIHRVLDSAGTSCFAMCDEACNHGHHQDTHAHFHCTHCGAVRCLPSVALPAVEVPPGFALESSRLVLDGTCNACNDTH
jgi:Fur family ferric uptake transcriptional regulator